MNKTKALVKIWLKIYKDNKNVEELPERGKTKSTSSVDEKRIKQVFFFKILKFHSVVLYKG